MQKSFFIKNIDMSASLNKLYEHIDQLVDWLRENPGIKPQFTQKQRLTQILDKVNNAEVISCKKPKRVRKSTAKKYNLIAEYIDCKCCGVILNVKNIEKHSKKCQGQKEATTVISRTPILIEEMPKNNSNQKITVAEEKGNKAKETTGSWKLRRRENFSPFPDR